MPGSAHISSRVLGELQRPRGAWNRDPALSLAAGGAELQPGRDSGKMVKNQDCPWSCERRREVLCDLGDGPPFSEHALSTEEQRGCRWLCTDQGVAILDVNVKPLTSPRRTSLSY